MATVVDAARKGVSIVVGAAAGGAANAGWFGDGRDGELNVADGETMELAVALDEGQIVKQYTSGYIGTGSLLTAANRCNGMVLLFAGDLIIKGTISMDKKAPFENASESTAVSEVHVKLCNLTGGKGGNGGTPTNTWNGTGGTGGDGNQLGGGWPGGGAGSLMRGYFGDLGSAGKSASNGGDGTRPQHGMSWPVTNGTYGSGGTAHFASTSTTAGSSPGGGGGLVYISSASGGTGYAGSAGSAYPGGGIWIFARGKVVIEGTGVVSADGGDGGRGGDGNAGGGGGAGGGIVAIVHNGYYSNAGSVRANAGKGAAANGADGEQGSVLITTLAELLAS